jgi:gliding motility-associated-like protein
MITIDSSNIAQTILLKATANANVSNTITWSSYYGFAGGDSCYALYRSIDGVLNPNPIAVLPYGRNSYTDSVSAFMNSQGEFCYYVVQYEATLDSFGFQDSSQSNLGCAAQSPGLFIPNSFTPFGKNPIFIPVWTFTDIHLYDLSIYSRLGELVFNSTNPFVGWDGTFQGYIVPMDVYVWTITLTGQNDTQIQRTGSVLVLR